MDNQTVKYADQKGRDLARIKICEVCGDKYHPMKGGLKALSRFCSPECAKKRSQASGVIACPDCGSENVRKIIYGKPSPSDRYFFGGEHQQPQRLHCDGCGANF